MKVNSSSSRRRTPIRSIAVAALTLLPSLSRSEKIQAQPSPDTSTVTVLAWTRGVGSGELYPSTLEAITSLVASLDLSETTADTPASLERDLRGAEVLLVPPTVGWAEAHDLGSLLARELRAFVETGGHVVALSREAAEVLRGADLLDAQANRLARHTLELGIEGADCPLTAGVSSRFESVSDTWTWNVEDAAAETIVRRTLRGDPVVLRRSVGEGSVTLLGFSFHDRNDSSTRLLVNAVLAGLRARDTDGDGIVDVLEERLGLDREDPTDADLDPDGDGLSTRVEAEIGTNPRSADSDGDGVRDDEEVADGRSDPNDPDTDDDGLTDREDRHPRLRLDATLETPSALVVEASAEITVRLLASSGDEADSATRRLRVRASGPIAFATSASAGVLLEGGGTGEVTLETRDGVATIGVRAEAEGRAFFVVLDPFEEGIVFSNEQMLDFEASNGGLTTTPAGGDWEWGVPSSGPRSARSGLRVWATGLSSTYSNGSASFLELGEQRGVERAPMRLEFHHYFRSQECCDTGSIEVAIDGGAFSPVDSAPIFRGRLDGYSGVTVDLAPYRQRPFRLRFAFRSDESGVDEGWYVDDIRLVGLERRVPVIARAGDDDADGLTNLAELERGTDPLRFDTDGDRLADAVETATGVFVDELDTGTNPLVRDTDSGGATDGLEIERGLDPHDPSDDFSIGALVRVSRADLDREVPFTIEAIRRHVPSLRTELIETDSGDELLASLEDKQLLVLAEQESRGPDLTPEQEQDLGAAIARFADGGGVVISLHTRNANLLRAAGVIDFGSSEDIAAGSELRIEDRGHVLAAEVLSSDGDFFAAPIQSSGLGDLSEGIDRIVTLVGSDHVVVLLRQVGLGNVVHMGFDYFVVMPETARLIANAARLAESARDIDQDGIPDATEAAIGLDPIDPEDAHGDLDEDGISNLDEHKAGTDPRNPDTDGDGIGDAVERDILGTDPLARDSDGDGIEDGDDGFPLAILETEVRPLREWSLVDRACRVFVAFESDGRRIDDPVVCALQIDGPARFAPGIISGRVLARTLNELIVETEAGSIEVDVEAIDPGTVRIEVKDALSAGAPSTSARFEVISLDGDPDADGLTTREELLRFSSPVRADTDGDGLGDAVETNTGHFVDLHDTGTSPRIADTDGGGLDDGAEVSEDSNPLDASDDSRRQALPVVLADAEANSWRFDVGLIASHDSDLSSLRLLGHRINGRTYNPPLPLEVQPWNGTVRGGPMEHPDGFSVERTVRLSQTSPALLRSVDTLTSTVNRDVRIVIAYFHRVRTRFRNSVGASSSGDTTFDQNDHWVVISTDTQPPSTGLSFVHVLGDGNSTLRPVRAIAAPGASIETVHEFTLRAGERVSLAQYFALTPNLGSARELAERLSSLDSIATAGLSEVEVRRLRNFTIDTDLDGIPDSVEVRWGLDPRDESDALRDPDTDGLTHRREYEVGTDLFDADSDDDGLPDGTEVLEIGSSPIDRDTDGDAVLDPDDPFPLELLELTIDAPTKASTGTSPILRARVTSSTGRPIDPERPIRFGIALFDASANAAPPAVSGLALAEVIAGRIIEGAGTSRGIIECEGDTAEFAITASRPVTASWRIDDVDGVGLLASGTFENRRFGFETDNGGWRSDRLSGAARTWSRSQTRAHTGRYSVHSGPSPASTADSAWVSPPLDLRRRLFTLFEFEHWYRFDDCDNPEFFADGGRLEIRRLGIRRPDRPELPAEPWRILEPLAPYPAILDGSTCPTPLGPVGEVAAYTGSTENRFRHASFDLSSFEGHIVQLRFHAAWDCGNCASSEAWFIDDVQVHGAPRTPNPSLRFEEDEPVFIRGDVNGSGDIDLTDAVALGGFLFRSGEPPSPLDAGDTDDDGRLTITDVYLIAGYLFLGESPPPAPFPEPGPDPTDDELR